MEEDWRNQCEKRNATLSLSIGKMKAAVMSADVEHEDGLRCDPMVARKHVNVVSIQRPHFDLSTDSQSLCQSAKYQLEYVTSCSG